MPIAWRQGDLIAPDDAIALNLIEPHQGDSHRALVVSHSCDISSPEAVEPGVEVLIGEKLDGPDANERLQNGHSIRRLDLGAPSDDGEEWTKFDIGQKKLVPKGKLLRCRPWQDRSYPAGQRRVLSRWLAQRYSRSAFPDAFNRWLKECFGSRLENKIKAYSSELIGVYFDLDDGDDNERSDPNDPYTLSIELVYDASDARHAASAETVASELRELFGNRCKASGEWRRIELVSCEPISDTAFSLRAANALRRWRLEHHSVSGEPLDESE